MFENVEVGVLRGAPGEVGIRFREDDDVTVIEWREAMTIACMLLKVSQVAAFAAGFGQEAVLAAFEGATTEVNNMEPRP